MSGSGPGIDQPASNAPSNLASANGRIVSMARWNQHYLLPLKNTNTPTDTTPDSNFTAPAWVYVTGTGPANPPLTSPTNTVIGRYAYAIYDESGLLDVNVAGCPASTSGTVIPTQYAPKGALAFADLTQLTDASGAPLITQAGVNNLVGWRNYASMSNRGKTPDGRFPGLFSGFSGSASAVSYEGLIVSNTNGFMTVSGSAANGFTDEAFLSRQQLIALALATGTTDFNPNALQYLGTFSRAVNAPSWSPVDDSTGLPGYLGGHGTSPILYKTDAETTGTNRDLANVRFLTAGTVTHYDDSGNQSTYTVQEGDPLIQRRFSLAKLAWLLYNGPKPSISAQAIQACFGLQWNNTNWRWEYVGPSGSTTQSSIETLAQVANEKTPREPNFFELLKAGILCGSLGQNPGSPATYVPPGTNNTGGVYQDLTDSNPANYKIEPDTHILQIGANIIDQADTDGYPIAIHLNPFGFSATSATNAADDLSIQTVYGIQNLPYLINLTPLALAFPRLPDPTTSGTSTTLYFWMQPELWNPHQVSTTTGTNRPTKLQAYVYGEMYPEYVDGVATPSTSKGTPIIYDNGTGAGANITNGEIFFTDPGDQTSPFYNNPCLLALDLKTGAGNQVVDTNLTPPGNMNNNKYAGYTNNDNGVNYQFAAFSVGQVKLNVPENSATQSGPSSVNKYDVTDPFAYFALRYLGSDSKYHPYNFVSRFYFGVNGYLAPGKGSLNIGDNLHGGGIDTDGGTTAFAESAFRLDPRTDRFATSGDWSLRWWHENTINTGPGNTCIWSPFGGAMNGCVPNAANFVYTPAGQQANGGQFGVSLWSVNDPSCPPVSYYGTNCNAYYADPDGVVRSADCDRQNTATGDGCELYHGNEADVDPAAPSQYIPVVQNGGAQPRRPVILNRPLRSVGELGFADRDLPFKTLDFWSRTSADGALLDLFSVSDEPAVVAGQMNPNSAPPPVLRAILGGAAKSDSLGVQISGSEAQMIATAMATDISGPNGPYANRADLASRLGPLISGTSGNVVFNTTKTSAANYSPNWANKAYAEAPVRALADVTNTRTWNLMIDVVAQTGRFAPDSPSTSAALNSSFIVQGERHYWLHIAIDRYTGKVVDQQLEPVYE
jgi:hypothetical protein